MPKQAHKTIFKIDGYEYEAEDENVIALIQHLVIAIDQWKVTALTYTNAINVIAEQAKKLKY